MYTLGEAIFNLSFGQKILTQKAVVLDTSAFQAVLGTDFLQKPRFGGLLTQPPPCKLLVDGEMFPLEDSTSAPTCHRLFRLFKKESYFLVPNLRDDALGKLEIPPRCVHHWHVRQPPKLSRTLVPHPGKLGVEIQVEFPTEKCWGCPMGESSIFPTFQSPHQTLPRTVQNGFGDTGLERPILVTTFGKRFRGNSGNPLRTPWNTRVSFVDTTMIHVGQ